MASCKTEVNQKTKLCGCNTPHPYFLIIGGVNSDLPDNKLIFIYGSGLMLFLEYLIQNNMPFKLQKENKRENKFNKNKFRELVKDKNCTELYILGHGRRHTLKISDKEFLYYLFYANAPQKKKVIQLHCNLGNYVSLSELLKADRGFKEKGSRWLTQNVIYFLKKSKTNNSISFFFIF